MSQTSPNSPSEMKKIRIHSPYFNTCLPQFWSKNNFAYKTGLWASSVSLMTEPAMKPGSPYLTQMKLPTTSSTAPTKRISCPPYQKFHVLIPLFNHLAECVQQFPSQTTSALIAPSSLPLPESVILLTMVKSMSATLKRSSELLMPCNTEAHPGKMTKQQLLLHDSTKSGD